MANFRDLPAELQDAVFSQLRDSRKIYHFLFDKKTHESAKIALYTYVKLVVWKKYDWAEFEDLSYLRIYDFDDTPEEFPPPVVEGALVLEKFLRAAAIPENAALLAHAESLEYRLSDCPIQPFEANRYSIENALHPNGTSRFLIRLYRLMPNLKFMWLDSPRDLHLQRLPHLRHLTVRGDTINPSLDDVWIDFREMPSVTSLSLLGDFGVDLPRGSSFDQITRLELGNFPGKLTRQKNRMIGRYRGFISLRELHIDVGDEYSAGDALYSIILAFESSKTTLQVISLSGDAAIKRKARKRKDVQYDYTGFTALRKISLPLRPEVLHLNSFRGFFGQNLKEVELIITSLEPWVLLPHSRCGSLPYFIRMVEDSGWPDHRKKYTFKVDRVFLETLREENIERYDMTMVELRKVVSDGIPCCLCDCHKPSRGCIEFDTLGIENFVGEEDRRLEEEAQAFGQDAEFVDDMDLEALKQLPYHEDADFFQIALKG